MSRRPHSSASEQLSLDGPVGWASVREWPETASYGAHMKISVPSATDGPADVGVLLTEREAEEVAQALRSRLQGDPGYRGPGYHLHLEDGEGSELTIGVLDPE